jgi:soluble lytic murein transglycosylase-like protein
MPARAGKTTYIPGKGSYTRGKSGKAKSYSGKGPAPSGSVKTPEKDYTEVPTVTVSSSGQVTTSGYTSPKAAKRAQRATERRQAKRERRRTTAILNSHFSKPQKPLPEPQLPKRYEPDPAKAVISSSPSPVAKPPTFQGHKTAGAPTRAELSIAAKQGGLKVNAKGFVTTPKVRVAAKGLKQAKKAVAKSQPSLKGLSQAERAVVPLARKAHRKYPDVPISVGMAQIKQESGFNPAAVSSAGAEGLTQFIPSTASAYGVKYGTGPKEKQSQVTGQFKLLHDDNFKTDPQGALSAYSGGYAAGDYNNPILQDARASYSYLDKPGNPKAVKALQRAKAEAARVGLKVAQGPAGKAGSAPRKLVTRTVAAEKAMKEVEGLPYVWGGGHGAPHSEPTGGGLDCSGAVGYVLNKIHAMKGSATSGDMGRFLEPGPGALTVFYNSEHTFLRLVKKNGEVEYWGTSVGDSGAGGLGPHGTPSASYLAQYDVGHVPGMGKKQALQLGAPPAALEGGGSFAGMSFSPSGTTATISGATTTISGEPGFSKKPIRLTPRQVANRTERKLEALATIPAKGSESSGGVSIADLEKKYGRAAV